MALEELSLGRIRAATEQPRKTFYEESLTELAASIKERGVLEPIVVRPMRDEQGGIYYRIVMGERRFRASKLAGRETIPAIIKEMTDGEAAADALLENFQREDLNPLEKAVAVQGLLEFMTMEKACRTLGVSDTTVRRLLELLQLPEEIQQELVARPGAGQAGVFAEGHARALLALNDDPKTQAFLVEKVKREKLSVGHLEQIVEAIQKFPAKKAIFLHVGGGVSEQLARSLSANEERAKPYRAQTAKEHLRSIDRRMTALTEILDDRMVSHLSLEEKNRLLALATVGARQLDAFCRTVKEAIENQDYGFAEVYTHCPLCGRVELVGGLRCSVCRTILRRCYDCSFYDEDNERCRASGGPPIEITEAENPIEVSRSYQCAEYRPKFKPKGLSLPVAASRTAIK